MIFFLILKLISQILVLFLYKNRRKQASIEIKIKIKRKYYIKSLHFGLCCKLGFDKPHIIHQMNKNSKKRKNWLCVLGHRFIDEIELALEIQWKLELERRP